ncbi:MAG: phosphotransferase family protein [Myxococcaceae bacterium]
MSALDSAKEVRKGEELDTAQLEALFRSKLPELSGPISVQQFPRGHSNLTYLLKVGDREVVLRRPPRGAKAIKTGHDMHREFTVLSKLRSAYPLVPKALLYVDEAESPLGASFYVMERVPGVILRNKPPADYELTPELMRRLSEKFVDSLAELHAIDLSKVGLSDFGKPDGYVQRQVDGWIDRYNKSKTDEIAEMETLGGWLEANVPPSHAGTLIHNEFKNDNLVLDPGDLTKIRAVLDWEMATVGDPLADLGTSLAYWFEPSEADAVGPGVIGLTILPGNLTREQVVERYGQKTGRDVSRMLFYYILGLYKVAVIAQQIYARFKKGLTTDERFGALIFAVNLLSQAGVTAMEKKRLSGLLG